ncbi:MAG: flagellar biosynthesis protein FlgL [Xanthobacteraceae bacterium]|uniref:flagellar biosynthesis protein FlgL n=1 Tax=Pseudolabrys sp. TaxID=1960880 RepID=UPI003D1202E5
MAISTVGSYVLPGIQTLLDTRSRLDDLQRQLATGQKSTTYSGLGVDRGLAVSLNAQLQSIGGFDEAIKQISTRLNIVQTTLGRVSDIGHEIKTATTGAPFDPDTGGQTTLQKTAASNLGELLGLLNTQVGDQYVFSGRDSEKPSVETLDHVLNGDGPRAGLKQLISERGQADLGVGGLGRLAITPLGTTGVQVQQDASPFGFKLSSVSTTIATATTSPPAGAPPSMSVDLGATNPNVGDTVTFSYTLPDGSNESVTLTATDSATPGPNEFTIGATSDLTAANMQAKLSTATAKLANTSLMAASAIKASSEFFAADVNNPPLRVDGPPFNTATGQIAGTSANTVVWYTGEVSADPARSSAVARVDSALVVSYGTRANEQGISWLIQNVATLAATTFSPIDPDGQERSQALNARLQPNLDVPAGTQKVENIQAELAAAQNSIKGAKDRHQQLSATLSDFLDQVKGVSNEEVGAQILALQTRLSASLQTTAMLYQTSLINYLR